MTEKTLLLIKPNAVQHRHVGHIISMVEEHGFVLTNIKIFKFSRDKAEQFYISHKGKDFFDRLVQYMCSGETVGIVLEKTNAVAELREMIGDADPKHRKANTIRAMYAEGVTENAVHASDSVENANREISIIF